MKTLLKTFLMMLITGTIALKIGSLLLHTGLLTHTLHDSGGWIAARISIYLAIVLLRDRFVSVAAKLSQSEVSVLQKVIPSRLSLILFFAAIEVFVIQGGFAWFIGKLLGVVS